MPVIKVWCLLENEEGQKIDTKAFHLDDAKDLDDFKSDIARDLPGDPSSYGFEFYHETNPGALLSEDTSISTITTTGSSRLIVKVINVFIKKQKLLGGDGGIPAPPGGGGGHGAPSGGGGGHGAPSGGGVEGGGGGGGGGAGQAAVQFKLSNVWKNPRNFCQGVGSSWDFQFPAHWVQEINTADRLKRHYEYWENDLTDKTQHAFFFISGGPGCGKSRCLDEFASILISAASEIPDSLPLQQRLKKMCIFKLSFENGTRAKGLIPDSSLIPAHMAFQLQESSLSWQAFIMSRTAQSIVMDDIIQHLVQIYQVTSAKELSILILIDGLQEAEAFLPLMNTICDLTNKSEPFIIIACAATIHIPVRNFLRLSGQRYVALSPPPIAEPSRITALYENLPSYSDRLIAKLLIQDLGGHGRALEILEEILSCFHFDPTAIVNEIKVRLKLAYTGWYPFTEKSQAISLLFAIIAGAELDLDGTIPGTTLTVERILQAGLFRYDHQKRKLTVAYIWMLVISERITSRELKTLLSLNDYDHIKDKLEHGTSSSLSPAAFEEFWCNFRVVRSRLYEDGVTVKWNEFHSGAFFTEGCDVDFENKHLTFSRAKNQFGTKRSSKDLITLMESSNPSVREKLLDKVILNGPGAAAGDSVVVVKDLNGEHRMEVHQDKRLDVSKLSTQNICAERKKAADPTDLFMVICSGKVDKEKLDELPACTAIIDADCWEDYFGSFAGRAFVYKHSGPINVNLATNFQLQGCIGVGSVLAAKIETERGKRQFDGPHDFQARVRHFPDNIMQQFCFE